MIAFLYWDAAQNDARFDVWKFISRDFARPWFEPYGMCGGYSQYASGQAAAIGLDAPAYMVATLFHSVATWSVSCEDALMTPRGHIISVEFVPVVWLLTGRSIQRLVQRRWRRRAEHFFGSAFFVLGLVLVPFGVLFFTAGIVYLLAANIWQALRFGGLAFWFLYFAALAAERLRCWPFDQIGHEGDEKVDYASPPH